MRRDKRGVFDPEIFSGFFVLILYIDDRLWSCSCEIYFLLYYMTNEGAERKKEKSVCADVGRSGLQRGGGVVEKPWV